MNVVLITTDQQKRDTVSAYGGSICATPNIDRIAQAGIRFDRAYTQHPYCQSSRATILTGLYASTHGVWNNGVDVPDSLVPQAITSRLRDVGWHTGFTGKGHFSTALTFQPTDRPENVAGSASYDPTTWDGPYMGFEWNRLAILGHYPATMMTPPQGMHYTAHVFHDGLDAGRARTALMGPQAKTDPSVTAPETWHAAVPYEFHPTHFTGQSAVDYIDSRAGEDTPFFFWASFADPHHPMDPPAPFAGTYDPADVTLAPMPDMAEFDTKPTSHRAWLEVEGAPPAFNPYWNRMSEEQRRQMAAAYYDKVAAVDHEVGRILDALAAAGKAEDTMVIFTTDHGEMLGDHGMAFKGPFHYEALLNVPLLVSGPGIPGGEVRSGLVGTVDVAPTVADLADAAHGRDEGRSLCPDLLDGADRTQDWALVENDHEQGPWKEYLRTIVTERAKLTLPVDVSLPENFGPPNGLGELYLLDEDPGETANRWDDPACGALKDDLLALLHSHTRIPAHHEPLIGFA